MDYTVPYTVVLKAKEENRQAKVENQNANVNRNESTQYPPAGAGRHSTNAFPVILSGQTHIGMWFITSQFAFTPHVPGHGSLHLLPTQALSLGQSVFSTHSGRHIT